MNSLGIYIELKDGQVKKTNLELLTVAHRSGRDSIGIVFTDDPGGCAEALKSYGLKWLLCISDAGGPGYHPEKTAQALAQIIRERGFSDFMGTHSAQGKDLLPRVAAYLEAPLATDCTGLDFENQTATRPVYAGKVMAQVKLTGEYRLYTLRPNTITPIEVPGSAAPEIESVAVSFETPLSEIREIVRRIDGQIDLTEAEIIVAGGRGMQNKENFKILEELATTLGAAMGASRAAVDAGYATQDMQVGQTGKPVNPMLYMACGISGAIQHFAGMKTSKVIVAINKDPDAPIFQKADYGIVGDLFEVVPILNQELQEVLNGD